MHKGSCLCGAVAYEIDGVTGPTIYCHCSRCRKGSGSSFATVTMAKTSDFRWTKGEASVKRYTTPAGVHRVFCVECGSPLYSQRDNQADILRLRAGSLDTPLDAQPSAHVFTGSKAAWVEINDGLTQHPERP